MFCGDIYISINDLMKLMGNYSQNYARKKHNIFRKEAGKGTNGLTIGDYCKVTGDDYCEVFAFLRGKLPPWERGKSKKQTIHSRL